MSGSSDACGRATEVRGEIAPARLAELSPAYFGMVMATGIVSIAAHLSALHFTAKALFLLNCLAYAVLWLLNILRIVRYPRRVFADLADHLRGPGYFTTVAGTCVLGSQFVLLIAEYRIALMLWGLAAVMWVGLTYTIFTGFTVKELKPTLDRGISGAWLLAVVATQSIAVFGALLAAHIQQPIRFEMNFLALSMWLWGGMLYIWMMSLIFYRYTFFPFSPGDLTPPYWINMGAMAISTLAGSLLILNSRDAPYLLSLLPFIKGFTVFYWATGTWWIPMLLILSVWRHGYKRFPLRYDPLYWGAVFPLGMYAASTHQMIEAMSLDFLHLLPRIFVYVALGAWTIVFVGLARYLLRHARVFRL
ncbi:MAG TPA: tellurite resistance/C4-dicarboxylate transporter family protein [Thiobacillaceae bacterium]|nr:tellurite resistance/C4-dicarboxylate transporter family protein [Thiobacillaceae bacterium]HNU65427.1 tellurite resistance/C4-dicarboxylate transporter family protein [Thiobacillaceae bacterium]